MVKAFRKNMDHFVRECWLGGSLSVVLEIFFTFICVLVTQVNAYVKFHSICTFYPLFKYYIMLQQKSNFEKGASSML